MHLLKHKLIILILTGIIFAAIFLFAETIFLRKAHSTFENYYDFRGCTKLLQRTEEYGICQIKSGKTIKIVRYNGRWFLDGDLPVCWHNICF